jgi:pimeloyl-ACP methyl ester carboxylesterase
VFKGDLYFYRVDGDLREKVKAIDTKVCPLYLLTGEYDFSCTPRTRCAPRADPGRRGADHEGVGHFPMSEHPAKFREYILPVLDEDLLFA